MRESVIDAQQFFRNLAIKFLKPYLAKANLKSHLQGLPCGITFSKILKKKLNHFHSLNLIGNLKCFSPEFVTSCRQKGLDKKAIVTFCKSFIVPKTNMNLFIYNYKKLLCSMFMFFVIPYEKGI